MSANNMFKMVFVLIAGSIQFRPKVEVRKCRFALRKWQAEF
jgi:hypothetical protein